MSNKLSASHFRFKNLEEAKNWNSDIETWHPISEINYNKSGAEIATPDFAWVNYDSKDDNLEFSNRQRFYCNECEEELVYNKGDLCDSCDSVEE